MQKFLKILKWIGIVLVILFIVAEIIRWPFRVREEKTAELVQKIHVTKLQLSDVTGDNLPPDPGVEADKMIAGIDANKNGIRDDVELAIFKEYPNSAKTRAVLLQYALALQMIFVQPIENKGTTTEVVRENSRSYACVGDALVPRKSPESSRSSTDVDKIDVFIGFVESRQLNTSERKKYKTDFYEKIGNYGESENDVCDIDYSTLSK